jgi:hypothetical protein
VIIIIDQAERPHVHRVPYLSWRVMNVGRGPTRLNGEHHTARATMGATPEVAGLILRLYEMRRDHELRKAREWFDTAFDPQSAQDVIGLVGSGFAQSAYFRMVLTYWEMVAALVNAGAIDAGLIHATNVEHLRYWAKLEPFIAEVREAVGPDFLPELEKLVNTAPDVETRLAGWRTLSKTWVASARNDQTPRR